MHQTRNITRLFAAGMALMIGACSDNTADQTRTEDPAPGAKDIGTLLDDQARDFMVLQPLFASSLGVSEDVTGGPYNDRLPDFGPTGFAAVRGTTSRAADALAALPRAGMTADEIVNLDVLEAINRYYAGAPDISYGYIDDWGGHLPYVVNQLSGPIQNIPKTMENQQPVSNVMQAEQYLQRLHGFKTAFLLVSDKMIADADAGLHLPLKLVPKTLKFIENYIAPEPAAHSLVTSFAAKLSPIEGLSDADKERLRDAAIDAIAASVYPAYRQVAATLVEVSLDAPEGDGIWAQAQGAEFYAHSVRYFGDTDMTADEIHAVGLSEVTRISAEMDAILTANGMTAGTVGERMVALGQDPQFQYPDTDAGRAKLLGDLNAQVVEINGMMGAYFNTIPPQRVEIRSFPKETQDNEPGGFYNAPSLDGSRPGVYWINLRDMGAVPSWSLNTLTYHEAVPGHHHQIAINMDQDDLAFMRKIASFNAFSEGWALYSELLAKEIGLYEGDPFGDLGRLQGELYRSVRLVVDTGLHHKRWTREEAIDYMHRTTGSDLSDVVPEIERYMTWPGQALGYKLGMLKFVALRQKAESALGDRFDIREYHDIVLLPGAMPLAILDRIVDRWIASKQAD